MIPPERGPLRAQAVSRRPARPPRRRSSVGPLLFVLLVIGAVAAAALVVRPMVIDAIVATAAERESLLRQPLIRALVAPRVGDLPDTALDPGGDIREFEVDRGERAASVAARLESEGFIEDAFSFTYVLFDTGKEDAIQSGTYRISAAMTPRELARIFEKAPGDQAVLKIIEGWRLTEIADAVAQAFPAITPDGFMAAAVVGDRTDDVLEGLDPETPLEGYLYPDTYFFDPEASPAEIVDVLLETFELRAGARLRGAAADRQISVYEIVKLASIVEREARVRTESPQIAGVYANRLEIGMKLDADPTIQYAKGDWEELVLDDLKLESPFNTYLNAGLPPTPICNPGLDALEAAATPASHDFLFFVATDEGTHLFARTLDEHEANRVKVGNR